MAEGIRPWIRAGQRYSCASRCMIRVSMARAALEELYAAASVPTVMAEMEITLTTSAGKARSWSPITLRNSRVRYNGPDWFTAITCCHCSSLRSRMPAPRSVPALLTRPSNRVAELLVRVPHRGSRTGRIGHVQAGRDRGTARPPRSAVRSPSRPPRRCRRPPAVAPPAASRRAVARPSPLPAPLIRTTRSCRSLVILCSLFFPLALADVPRRRRASPGARRPAPRAR